MTNVFIDSFEIAQQNAQQNQTVRIKMQSIILLNKMLPNGRIIKNFAQFWSINETLKFWFI